ncbi:MAG: DNA polymerase III subunit chi [Halioglobus sp.]|uniref:DNA polymerase III subunit chi n=1 Tax=Candidatus Seongchinamella marina TaxID=2518990 RepID=A0ABT3SX53_9GAMM|nr:DNA polymerase III subunit chi [Candidatus Seongchinamella marina]EEB79165.1 DNA polymerase III, chi subunit superfamily [marine gamma proteobacterium HTCC2148]MBT6125985.1 DNA polymerase III subunit chi [Halieaceae bacterium]MDG1388354.1 DNA polymerase III subunit chi [Halioglobus sp.]MBT7719369.1 DNA polymerase III subunit chi [Halieaceae bacterium]MCX2974464.1 DNA polymerase III subunit chi [Candidatus Seongchinamella marina]
MTRVGFYVVQAAAAGQRLEVAARLADKAYAQGHNIYINATDKPQAQALNELLWSFRPASFMPHALAGEEQSEQIAIGWGQDPGKHSDLLINLQLEIPSFFSRFARVAEVVTQDEDSLAALRKSWLFYKERGYHLEKHDL